MILLVQLINNEIDNANNENKVYAMRSLTDNISNSIILSYSGGNGHKVYLSLPKSICNCQYNIYIKEDEVYCVCGNLKCKSTIFVPVDNVELYANKEYLFENENNKVRVVMQ
ncbi:hypothetical protein Mfer_1144 [Methanothermus fervidus DSM 2088]|uniref:Uncharacterized protein n=1 Tax=Methanothermus fervidus (strain ATCC 43054 / DSM 2088 / JCM 10308 / V24 S) TaxID=523846 RepID=E3GWG5_METFV|nr:hypothetical protein Mfer_1144 [Methanothermus fervidus DSM 2088]